jgi:hypothetical protein
MCLAVLLSLHQSRCAQDPLLEGERVLHDLDTIHPSDLVDQLLALGLAAAAALLEEAPGAALPAVADVGAKFRRWVPGGLLRAHRGHA